MVAVVVVMIDEIQQLVGSNEILVLEDARVARALVAVVRQHRLSNGVDCMLGEVGMLASCPLLCHTGSVGALSLKVALSLLHARLLARDILECLGSLAQDLDLLVVLVCLGPRVLLGHGSKQGGSQNQMLA